MNCLGPLKTMNNINTDYKIFELYTDDLEEYKYCELMHCSSNEDENYQL